jgi:hypothetical protein
MLLTIQANKVIRIDVADNTLDLSIYLWERNWPSPHDVGPSRSCLASIDVADRPGHGLR